MKEKMLQLMEQVLGVPQGTLQPDTEIVDVPTWDSLASVMLLSELEEELGVSIPIEEAAEFTKVSDFLDYAGRQA